MRCLNCRYILKCSRNLPKHIETKHIMFNGHDCNLCDKRCPSKHFLKVHILRQYRAKIEYFPIFLLDNTWRDSLSVISWQFANLFSQKERKGKKQVGAELGQAQLLTGIWPIVMNIWYLILINMKSLTI